MTGLSQKYYYSLKDIESQNTVELGNQMTVNKVETEDAAKATFTVTIPANSQVYLNLPNITFSNENQKELLSLSTISQVSLQLIMLFPFQYWKFLYRYCGSDRSLFS